MRVTPITLEVDVAGTVAGLQRVAAALHKVRSLSTSEYCNEIRVEADAILQENNTHHEGILKKSMVVDETPGGHRLVVRAPHGAVIEYGRRPAGIPIEVVLDNRAGLTFWVRKKMQPSGVSTTEGYQRIAYAIARKKAKTRQAPKPFIRPAIERKGGPEKLKDIAVEKLIIELQ